MSRHVVIRFQVGDEDADRTDDEVYDQAETVVTMLEHVPASWTYEGSLVLDDDALRHHRLA